jgi:hypothetical protein
MVAYASGINFNQNITRIVDLHAIEFQWGGTNLHSPRIINFSKKYSTDQKKSESNFQGNALESMNLFRTLKI